jgi:hypothetical protein
MAERSIKISVDIVQGAQGTQKLKGTLNEVNNEVKRINKETADSAKQTQKIIGEAAKQRAKTELDVERSLLKSKQNFLRTLEADAKSSAKKVSSIFGDSFKGSFAGSFLGTLSTQLAKAPAMLRSTIDEMVSIAAERQNAFKGLDSIAIFKGIDSTATSNAVKNLRFVKAGIVDVASASTALKSLLQTNFTLGESPPRSVSSPR